MPHHPVAELFRSSLVCHSVYVLTADPRCHQIVHRFGEPLPRTLNVYCIFWLSGHLDLLEDSSDWKIVEIFNALDRASLIPKFKFDELENAEKEYP